MIRPARENGLVSVPMRRALGIALVTVCLVAVPAAAKSKTKAKTVTALALVTRLAKDGVCKNPIKVDVIGTQAKCEETGPYSLQGTIEVFAFKTKKEMLASLEAARAKECKDFGFGAATYLHPRYRVGPTWWTHPYRDLTSPLIQDSIGGEIKEYSCA